jgi:hypothetical protein
MSNTNRGHEGETEDLHLQFSILTSERGFESLLFLYFHITYSVSEVHMTIVAWIYSHKREYTQDFVIPLCRRCNIKSQISFSVLRDIL